MVKMMMILMIFSASRRLRARTAWQSRLRSSQCIDWFMEPRRHHLPRRHWKTAVPVLRRTTEQRRNVRAVVDFL